MKTPMISVMVGAGVLCALSIAAQAEATPEAWTYKDWSVDREIGADNAVSCNLSANKGSLPLMLTVSRDAVSREPYPTITLVAAVNTGPMAVAETVLSRWRFDGGTVVIPAVLNTEYVGEQNLFVVDSADAGRLLAAMAQGNSVSVENDAFSVTTYGLAGFSAVYRKMAEWCDFSVEGVL